MCCDSDFRRETGTSLHFLADGGCFEQSYEALVATSLILCLRAFMKSKEKAACMLYKQLRSYKSMLNLCPLQVKLHINFKDCAGVKSLGSNFWQIKILIFKSLSVAIILLSLKKAALLTK